ncbi:Uncharacterized protein OS=Blastopirellula marina DSM 3645 GN=DSM3645_19518 PE=4 SV=1 [Gemmataceae bacterium]|nr:Uncharacterized protein OS=Blastopirellula marina DSM 3645 GN=DSM3645_19518 PE=4 SV=1 [Gemmataceae bacterium]VTT96688.1 Uncharacterized protein OS=Blastopirellula marina DSM 3645 GN=DSM3645_19518 PE=4 SV=1 [Gemmataceae bacterium]
MIRIRFLALVAAVAAVSAASASAADWATVKGQVVFPKDKPVPKRDALNVSQDKDHCLSKGDILDESVIVNPKNNGIKNVVVWLRPDDKDPKAKFTAEQITPEDAKRKPAEVTIDQPCCMFVDRVTIARPGDKLVVKNSAPVAHNFFWSSGSNGEYNVTVPKMEKWVMPEAIKAESPPIQYKCTIHGWMTGYVRVFDHPYYAVTDADGNFEIKNAPAGKFRIVYWHENGFKGGAQGRFGEEIEIKGPTTEVKAVDFDISPKK